jgi:hypothetical protein
MYLVAWPLSKKDIQNHALTATTPDLTLYFIWRDYYHPYNDNYTRI